MPIASVALPVSPSGDGSIVSVSSLVITWQPRYTPFQGRWNALAYGAGMFVAVAYQGTGNRVMTSGVVGLA